jgi:hypothetical protein
MGVRRFEVCSGAATCGFERKGGLGEATSPIDVSGRVMIDGRNTRRRSPFIWDFSSCVGPGKPITAERGTLALGRCFPCGGEGDHGVAQAGFDVHGVPGACWLRPFGRVTGGIQDRHSGGINCWASVD